MHVSAIDPGRTSLILILVGSGEQTFLYNLLQSDFDIYLYSIPSTRLIRQMMSRYFSSSTQFSETNKMVFHNSNCLKKRRTVLPVLRRERKLEILTL